MHPRPVDLARARREAKALLRAVRGGDAAALARIGSRAPKLSDAQLAVARELGARSWPALVRRAEAEMAAREQLESALVQGDLERVGAELARDPDAASRPLGNRGWAPLLHVAYSHLLGGGRTDGLIACAGALLDAGADPDAAWLDDDYERMTALHGAVLATEPRMVALLLRAGADPDDGRSLRAAAGAEDPACLELLLDAGATLLRSMALAHAAHRGALRTARLLLERGPEQWGERENALVWAVRGEAPPEMLRLLVEHGADLEASFDGSGRTPYGDAIRAGRRDLAEVLASLGAQRRAEPLDELVGACLAGDAVTASRLAARHPEAARLVRTSEADLLARAAGRGKRAAVEVLLDLGVGVDARGPRGETALEAAVEGGHEAIGALLLERGADPRKRTPSAPARPSAPEPPYAELAWAAEAAYLRVLCASPRAESRPVGDGFAVATGIADNTENGVVCDRDDDEAVTEVLSWLSDRGAPAQWLVGAESDLGERLVAAGASPERTGVVMGAQLDRLVLDARPRAGLEIVAVRDRETLAAWRDVAAACLFDDADERAHVLESLGLSEDAPLQHRVALRDGRPVGVATFLLDGTTAYGRHLGVLAPERRSGIGRALTEHVLAEARGLGATIAVLGPTPDTIAFYRLLGFVLRADLGDCRFHLPSR